MKKIYAISNSFPLMCVTFSAFGYAIAISKPSFSDKLKIQFLESNTKPLKCKMDHLNIQSQVLRVIGIESEW